jgi:hypothetical protein
MENLQTLCKTCNVDKGLNELNFGRHASPLRARPATYALLPVPAGVDPRDVEEWEQHIRRTLNFFYQCAAVQEVRIKRRGPDAGHWRATLFPGNDVRWASARFLRDLCRQIEDVRAAGGLSGPVVFTVDGGGQ